jgi:GNAT superfamily N-acetyltransferase
MGTVRLARPDDVMRCAELLGVLLAQEGEHTPDPEVQARGLGMILEDPRIGSVFVYEIGGRVQGMVVMLFTISTALAKRVAVLEDVVVSADVRERGVGTRLVHYAAEYARKAGCGRVTLLTYHDNKPAHGLYHKTGFTRSDMVCFKRLLAE